MAETVDQASFYQTYHGHDVDHLETVHTALRDQHTSVVFLAGDSSLDNKFWFRTTRQALNGYEEVLRPPMMKADVCYWMNEECIKRGALSVCCLNTAIEATSLSDRACCHLQPQDRFIADHLTQEDYLVVSVGGNDIALKPLLCTILNMLIMTRCVPQACLDHCTFGCPPVMPMNTCVDGGCFCCGLPGCITGTVCAWPPGMGYFLDLFGNIVQNYIRRLVGCARPAKIAVCMIYYPDELATGSWADTSLGALGYDGNPQKLQAAISAVFRVATSRICIQGSEVVAVPLFEVLDGKTTSDYVARVEPSAQGGAKMAAQIMTALGFPEAQQAPHMQGMA